MAKKRRSSQFKDTSQVIDIEEARRKRQEKRNKQHRRSKSQREVKQPSNVRSSIKAGRRKRKLLYAVIILAIIAAIGMSVFNIVSLKADQKLAKEEQQRMLEEKKQLQQQLKESSDPLYIENTAREALRMIKPGETIYVMPNGDDADSDNDAGSDKDKESE